MNADEERVSKTTGLTRFRRMHRIDRLLAGTDPKAIRIGAATGIECRRSAAIGGAIR